MPLPSAFKGKSHILKPARKRSRKLDLTGRRSKAYERRALTVLSKARLLAGGRKQTPFAKKRKTQAEGRLKRR
jgi:hypothetical protein